jgi:hypothetical protein
MVIESYSLKTTCMKRLSLVLLACGLLTSNLGLSMSSDVKSKKEMAKPKKKKRHGNCPAYTS